MKQNTNVDYFEEDPVNREYLSMDALELSDFIEDKIKNRGRMTKQVKKEINELVDEYNKKFGKYYTRV